jgi:hypothetical protein
LPCGIVITRHLRTFELESLFLKPKSEYDPFYDQKLIDSLVVAGFIAFKLINNLKTRRTYVTLCLKGFQTL